MIYSAITLASIVLTVALALYGLTLKGWGWKLASAVPLLTMLYVGLLTYQAWQVQSNDWPLLLIATAPRALTVIVLVLLGYWIRRSCWREQAC